MPSKIEGNKSVEKAIAILDAFSVKQQRLGTQQLEKITGMPRATLYRLLNPLLENGYLYFDEATRKYSLGIKIYERAGVVKKGFELTSVLHHHLDKAKDYIGHTIIVGVLRDSKIVQIDIRENYEGLKIGTYVGKIVPPTHGLLGKILLSYLPREKSLELIENNMPLKWCGRKEFTIDDMYQTLNTVRETEFAISNDDLVDGVSGVGFPIFNHSGKCIAAIAILIPTVGFNEDEKNRCIKHGRRLAKSISNDMGYSD